MTDIKDFEELENPMEEMSSEETESRNNAENPDEMSEEDFESLFLQDSDEEFEKELDSLDENSVEDQDSLLARTILEACEGMDENGKAKAAFALALSKVPCDLEEDIGDEEEFLKVAEKLKTKTIMNAYFYNPILSISPKGNNLEISFTCKSPADKDLKMLRNYLERFESLLRELPPEPTEVPFLTLTVVPLSGMGMVYFTGINPSFWAIQPVSTRETELRQFKILFSLENIAFYETDDIEFAEIVSEAQREAEEKENALIAMEEKEEEKYSREAERNQSIENLRRGE